MNNENLDALVDLWFSAAYDDTQASDGNDNEMAKANWRARMTRVRNAIIEPLRNDLLNLLADGEFGDDYDGDVDDYGRSVSFYRFNFSTVNDSDLKIFLADIGLEVRYDEGPADAIERAINPTPTGGGRRLDLLLFRARRLWDKMTPSERELMMKAQAKSWAESETTLSKIEQRETQTVYPEAPRPFEYGREGDPDRSSDTADEEEASR